MNKLRLEKDNASSNGEGRVQNQQKLIQKINEELDAERVSAAYRFYSDVCTIHTHILFCNLYHEEFRMNDFLFNDTTCFRTFDLIATETVCRFAQRNGAAFHQAR